MKTASVGKTIIEQMGGPRRLTMFLGVKEIKLLPNGAMFYFPNSKPSRGNLVEVLLDPSDTYTMNFYHASNLKGTKKLVKSVDGVYAEQLIPIFERQTGYYLKFAKEQALIKQASELLNLTAKTNWVKALEDYVHDNPLPSGDSWDVVKVTSDEFKVKCKNSVRYLHAKEYDEDPSPIISVVGKNSKGKAFKRQFDMDDKLVSNLLKLLKS